jgi:hypothetical protein
MVSQPTEHERARHIPKRRYASALGADTACSGRLHRNHQPIGHARLSAYLVTFGTAKRFGSVLVLRVACSVVAVVARRSATSGAIGWTLRATSSYLRRRSGVIASLNSSVKPFTRGRPISYDAPAPTNRPLNEEWYDPEALRCYDDGDGRSRGASHRGICEDVHTVVTRSFADYRSDRERRRCRARWKRPSPAKSGPEDRANVATRGSRADRRRLHRRSDDDESRHGRFRT